MTDQMQISLIKSQLDKASGAEHAILASIYDELMYRFPKERTRVNGLCPSCDEYVDSKALYCPQCGQCLG